MGDGLDDHIHAHYKILKRVGKGAYGIVYRAVDKRTKKEVALKRIFDAFSNSTDAQRTFREVMFLQEFQNHDNIVRLLDMLPATNDMDIYLVFDYMQSDLHKVIKSGILKEIHKKTITHQIFRAMKYIHSAGVIHRDLKPSNILLDRNCHVKICDFGLARSILCLSEDETNPALTDYVATRWYRAPEILLGSKAYTKGVDTWSIGCIIAEMFLTKAMFPGTDTFDQISRVRVCLPRPTKEDLEAMSSPYATRMLDRTAQRGTLSVKTKLAGADPSAVELIEKLFKWNPAKRPTAAEAIKHPYMSQFHNPATEPDMPYDVVPPFDDSVMLAVDDYRRRLRQAMRSNNKRLCVTQNFHSQPVSEGEEIFSSAESTSRDMEAVSTAYITSTPPVAETVTVTTSPSTATSMNDSCPTASTTQMPAQCTTADDQLQATVQPSVFFKPGNHSSGSASLSPASTYSSESRERSDLDRPSGSSGPSRVGGQRQPVARYQGPARAITGLGRGRGRGRGVQPKYESIATSIRRPSQTWLDARAEVAIAKADVPRKESALARLSSEDYVKSFSAPDLQASGVAIPSPAHSLRTSMARNPMPGASVRGLPSHLVRQSSTNAWQGAAAAQSKEDKKISFQSRSEELHETLVPGFCHKAPPITAIPKRSFSQSLDDQRTQLTRMTIGDGQARPGRAMHIQTASRRPTAVRVENGLMPGLRSTAGQRPPSDVDAVVKSATRRATTAVMQNATASRRRQYSRENQFARNPVGQYTSTHGMISSSTLSSLKNNGRKHR